MRGSRFAVPMAVTVLVEFVAQRADADVEELGGVSTVALALFQSGKNVAFFELAQCAEFGAMAQSSAARFRSQPKVLRLQPPTFAAKDDRAFDDILEFAHVTRPGMVFERLHARVGNSEHFDAVFAGEA